MDDREDDAPQEPAKNAEAPGEPKNPEAVSDTVAPNEVSGFSSPREGRKFKIVSDKEIKRPKYRQSHVIHLAEKARKIAEASRPDDKAEKLTPEEQTFADAVVEGYSLGQAWNMAWSPDEPMAATQAYNRGSSIMRRAHVAGAIASAFAEKESREGGVVNARAPRLRTFIAQQLELIATTSTNDQARISALDKLGKLHDVKAFEEHQSVTITDTHSAEDIKAELTKRLAAIKKP